MILTPILTEVNSILIERGVWKMTRLLICSELYTKTEKEQLEILEMLKNNPEIEMKEIVAILEKDM